MTLNTSSWSVKENFNKAKLKFVIPDFSDLVCNTRKGDGIKSKQCDVGGSKFALMIYPNGSRNAEEGMLSVFLHNESNHDVVVDYTISVEGGNRRSWENIRIEKCDGIGWKNFMRASEVGTGLVGTDLKTTVEVELKWEDLSGGVVQENQVNSKDLTQVEERLGRKLMLMGGQLEHNMGGKLEQMKTFVLAELDQQQQQMKTFVQEELAKVKATSIPECPVCFMQLKPPNKIVQCLKGHKICEPCSEKEAVVSCLEKYGSEVYCRPKV